MRRFVLSSTLVALCLVPGMAWAKMFPFGLKVVPLRPTIGEPITLTMTCYRDQGHTRPTSSCYGTPPWDRMAWIHPLDDEGQLDRNDWIAVEGHATRSGATRGTIRLAESGSYDILPLWRTWNDRSDGSGFPGVIRIEVGESPRVAPMAVAAFAILVMIVAIAVWRSRPARLTSVRDRGGVAVRAGEHDAHAIAG
jgi:hypothetical protein